MHEEPIHELPHSHAQQNMQGGVQTESDTYAQDFMYSCISRRYSDWPFTCCRFGPHISANKQYNTFQFFLAYRTDSEYSKASRSWNKSGSSIIVGQAEFADDGNMFLEEYECLYGVENHKRVAQNLYGGLEFNNILVEVG